MTETQRSSDCFLPRSQIWEPCDPEKEWGESRDENVEWATVWVWMPERCELLCLRTREDGCLRSQGEQICLFLVLAYLEPQQTGWCWTICFTQFPTLYACKWCTHIDTRIMEWTEHTFADSVTRWNGSLCFVR